MQLQERVGVSKGESLPAGVTFEFGHNDVLGSGKGYPPSDIILPFGLLFREDLPENIDLLRATHGDRETTNPGLDDQGGTATVTGTITWGPDTDTGTDS